MPDAIRGPKILAVCEYFPPSLASDRRIFELMSRLSQRMTTQFLVVPPARTVAGLRSEHDDDLLSSTYEGMDAYRLPLPKIIPQLWIKSTRIAFLLLFLYCSFQAIRVMRRLRPDIVILNYPSIYTGMIGYVSARIAGRRVVVDFCDLIAQYTIHLFRIPSSSFKARLLVAVQDYLLSHANKVIVSSSALSDYARRTKVDKDRLFLVPNGVDTSVFTPLRLSQVSTDSVKVCTYTGRIASWAGIDIITRVAEKLETSAPNVEIHLYGDRGNCTRLRKNICYKGAVPHEQVPSVLTSSDIILIPFPNSDIAHATSPLKLFEALAAERPLVASDVRGIREVISPIREDCDGTIRLVQPENTEEWVAAIKELASLPNSRHRDGVASYVKANYDWTVLAERYRKALSEA